MSRSVISRNPEIMGGAAVCDGTRVPVQILLDYLEAGDTIDEFLKGFPSVTREQIVPFLGRERPPGRIGFVKIHLDECVDWRLARAIGGHEVKTARQMGWRAIRNGELLTLASQEFDVFATVDRNLHFSKTSPDIAVIVLRPQRNRLADLMPLVPEMLAVRTVHWCRKSAVATRKSTIVVVNRPKRRFDCVCWAALNRLAAVLIVRTRSS